jgi:hypothetical protein
VATFISVTTAVNAQGLLGNKFTNNNLVNVKFAPAIFTTIEQTDHDYWAFVTYEYYAGTSVTDPCSDMSHIRSDDGWTIINNYTDKITSCMLTNFFGPAKTCVRIDISLAGTIPTFTTGNIQLLWDESSKTYTAATPSKVTIDLSEGG